MLKFSCLIFSFFCFANVDVKPFVTKVGFFKFAKCSEMNLCGKKLVVANKKTIGFFNLDADEKEVKEVFSFEVEQKVAPKIACSNDIVFFNKEDGVFYGVDYEGKIIFSRNLPSVSRSDLFVVDDVVIFSLVNQYIMCYSNIGDLVWVKRDYFTSENFISSKILVADYIYFLHQFGFFVLHKKTGRELFAVDKRMKNFYVYNKSFVHGLFSDRSYTVDLSKKKVVSHDESFPEKILVGNAEYSYKKGVLKNVKTGNELVVNLDFKDFAFFDDCFFTWKGKRLLFIKDGKVNLLDLDVNIKKLFYKNGYLIISDDESVQWTKI